jgi:hypothetical protein
MYKKVLAVVATLFLLSCDSQPVSNTGADGYKFGPATYEKDVVTIELVTYNSEREFRDEVNRRQIKGDKSKVVAFAVLRPPSFDTCEIHIVKPTVRYIPEFMGHETYHCFYGSWHK